MTKRKKIPSLLGVFVVGLAFGLIALHAPSPALAAPPLKKDCSQADVFERLACRQEGLADQVEYTSDTVFADGTELNQRTSPARLKHIGNAKEKAMRAKRKNTKEVFKRQAKAQAQGNKKGGHLVPFDDVVDDVGGDGICDYEQGDDTARCAAIELDQSGNLQVCNPEKKNKGKGKGPGNPKWEGLECDLSYDFDEAQGADEAADMQEAAEQLDATYSAVEDDLIEMNEVLDTVNANLAASPALRSTAVNGCAAVPPDPVLAGFVTGLRIGHGTVFGAARIAADFGGQDFVAFGFGGNTRTVAVVADSIALAANIAYMIVDEIHKDQSAEYQRDLVKCVSQDIEDFTTPEGEEEPITLPELKADISALQDDILALQSQIAGLELLVQQQHDEIVANDNANMATMLGKLEEVRAEVVNLLITPPGRRPEFPDN